MDDRVSHLCSRWRLAEEVERDDEADAAFGALSRVVLEERMVPLHFTARTLAATADAMAHDARRARLVRKTFISMAVAVSIVAAYFGFGPAMSAISSLLVASLDLTIQGVVWVSSGPPLGVSSILNNVGRAAAAFIADPAVTVVMLAIQGVAIAALVALRRLLGSDREILE